MRKIFVLILVVHLFINVLGQELRPFSDTVDIENLQIYKIGVYTYVEGDLTLKSINDLSGKEFYLAKGCILNPTDTTSQTLVIYDVISNNIGLEEKKNNDNVLIGWYKPFSDIQKLSDVQPTLKIKALCLEKGFPVAKKYIYTGTVRELDSIASTNIEAQTANDMSFKQEVLLDSIVGKGSWLNASIALFFR